MELKQLGTWSTCAQVRSAVSKVPGNKVETFENSTTIVTGANTGIGKKTAQELAFLGGVVVVACRDLSKADQAINDIHNDAATKRFLASKENNGKLKELKLVALQLDLSSLESVKKFVETYKEKSKELAWPKLYCLVLNAGVATIDGYKESKEGYEITFAVNHLGHFLLTELFLSDEDVYPLRVVVVSSASHFGPLLAKGTDLLSTETMKAKVVAPGKKTWKPAKDGFGAYGSSKLCNVLFAQELARKYSNKGLVSVSLHPGNMIATEITRSSRVLGFVTKYILSWFTKSIDQGSSTTLLCCLLPDDQLHGQYFSSCKEAKISHRAKGEKGEKAASVLWNLSEELCRSFL